MTQEEILAGNKLIAEFMGGKPRRKGIRDTEFIFQKSFVEEAKLNFEIYDDEPYLKITEMTRCYVYDMKFHSSWDWIMPVVEKISNTVIKGHPPFNSDEYVKVEIICNGYVKIYNFRDTPIFTNVSTEGSLIIAIYKAVVQFIKWYNSVNSTK